MMWIWLGVMGASLLIELGTMEVVSIWFTFGAIIPFILEVIGVNLEWQLVTFVIISALLIAFLRKITKKFLLRNSEGKTNLETIIGKKYKLIEPITEGLNGAIKINGVVWTAITDDDSTINIGEMVEYNGYKICVNCIKKLKLLADET